MHGKRTDTEFNTEHCTKEWKQKQKWCYNKFLAHIFGNSVNTSWAACSSLGWQLDGELFSVNTQDQTAGHLEGVFLEEDPQIPMWAHILWREASCSAKIQIQEVNKGLSIFTSF